MKDWMWLTLAGVALYLLVKRGGTTPTGGGATHGSHVINPPNPGRTAWTGIDLSSADALHNTTAAVAAETQAVFGTAQSAGAGIASLFSGIGSIFDRFRGKPTPSTSGSGAGTAQHSSDTAALGALGNNPDGPNPAETTSSQEGSVQSDSSGNDVSTIDSSSGPTDSLDPTSWDYSLAG